MKINNTRKLAATFLACALVLGGAVGASATEPSKGSDNGTSATMAKEITVLPLSRADKGDQTKKLRITRLDGENTKGLEIKVVPLSAVLETTKAQEDGERVVIKMIPLASAKTIPVEKNVVE